MEELKSLIREIPDYPKPGILFYDLTTLFQDRKGFRTLMERMLNHYRTAGIDVVAGIEARGFVIAPVLAFELGAGFIPVRKPGKLPADVHAVDYELEYGLDRLEIHRDALTSGHKVVIVDDLLATGGTAKATVDLVQALGAHVAGCLFVIELGFLNGRDRLAGVSVSSLISY